MLKITEIFVLVEKNYIGFPYNWVQTQPPPPKKIENRKKGVEKAAKEGKQGA